MTDNFFYRILTWLSAELKAALVNPFVLEGKMLLTLRARTMSYRCSTWSAPAASNRADTVE